MKGTFLRLFQYTLNYKGLVLMANFGMLVSAGGMVLLPMLCGIIIDHIKN
jgi:ABC-type multidrug transport system fused ATPase/permease subunit